MNGSNLSVEVSEAVYLALDENRRKAENLYHEKRRHWDARAFDESIMLGSCFFPFLIFRNKLQNIIHLAFQHAANLLNAFHGNILISF